jgi:hypothetical protein
MTKIRDCLLITWYIALIAWLFILTYFMGAHSTCG